MEKLRILLVDDEAPLLRLMSEYLARLGYDVEGCSTAKDALRLLQESAGGFALMVVDLSLPDLPGDELVHRVIAAYRELPVLICSGLPYSLEQLPHRVRFLQKPFLPKMLAKQIDAMIGAAQ